MCNHLLRQGYPLFLTGFVLPCVRFNIYTCQLARPAALSCTRCAGLSNGGRFVTTAVNSELGNSRRPLRVLRITAADVQQHGSMFGCLPPELAVAPGDWLHAGITCTTTVRTAAAGLNQCQSLLLAVAGTVSRVIGHCVCSSLTEQLLICLLICHHVIVQGKVLLSCVHYGIDCLSALYSHCHWVAHMAG